MTPTPTSGAADLPKALRLAEEITELMCSTEAAARTIAAAADELVRLHALAAGQAIAAPAQPAAQQGVAYAALPEPHFGEGRRLGLAFRSDAYSVAQVQALFASHGQAPAQAAPAAVAVPTFEDFCKRHGLDPKKMDGHGGMWARVALDECRATAQPSPASQGDALNVTHKGRCQHCIDRHDGVYGSWAAPCPYHDDDGNLRIDADRAARATADSVLEDAARWQETLMHVGAASHLGGQHFTLNTLRIRDQMFLLRGSVAQHFTACIDDSRAARKQGEKQ